MMTGHVGCMPCHQIRGKKTEIDNTACGLHTMSSNKGKKQKLTIWHVGCMLYCQTKGKKKQKLTTQHVGCTPCHQMRGKKTKIDNMACGLHATLLNEREKKTKINNMACAHHVVE